MKNLSARALRQNIRIFQEWFIPAWESKGDGSLAIEQAKRSIRHWKQELRRRGLKINQKIRCGGFIEKMIVDQKRETR